MSEIESLAQVENQWDVEVHGSVFHYTQTHGETRVGFRLPPKGVSKQFKIYSTASSRDRWKWSFRDTEENLYQSDMHADVKSEDAGELIRIVLTHKDHLIHKNVPTLEIIMPRGDTSDHSLDVLQH